jgi:hypothetical protein
VLSGRAQEAAAAGLDAADFDEDEDEDEESVLVEDVSDFVVSDLAVSDLDASALLLSDFALAPMRAASRLSVR